MIAFVVLHYKLLDETQKCVESIINSLEEDRYRIVIVDNGSRNSTGEKLFKLYQDNLNLKVLLLDENLGFSAGNNIGCKYAIKNFNPDFLYVVNNDTIIEDKDSIDKIQKCYNQSQFDICGPYIWNSYNKKNDNPRPAPNNYNEAMDCVNDLKKGKKFLKMNHYLYYLYCKFFSKKVKLTGFGINGAAIIFSKKYFDSFEQVFPEQTFIYCEESMLTYRTNKYKLQMVYCENIKIIHNHSKSTSSEKKSKKKLWTFQNDNILRGYERLAELYKNDIDI